MNKVGSQIGHRFAIIQKQGRSILSLFKKIMKMHIMYLGGNISKDLEWGFLVVLDLLLFLGGCGGELVDLVQQHRHRRHLKQKYNVESSGLCILFLQAWKQGFMYIVPSKLKAGVYVYCPFKLESSGLCILFLQALKQGFMYIVPSSFKAGVYV